MPCKYEETSWHYMVSMVQHRAEDIAKRVQFELHFCGTIKTLDAGKTVHVDSIKPHETLTPATHVRYQQSSMREMLLVAPLALCFTPAACHQSKHTKVLVVLMFAQVVSISVVA